MGMNGQRHAPGALPPGKTRYPLNLGVGGGGGRAGLDLLENWKTCLSK